MTILQGKVALISGGAGGLGAACVRAFAEQGAKVVFGDLLDDEGQLLERELRSGGSEAAYVHLDVTEEADWRAAVQTATGRYGKLDILVNNAGIVLALKECSAQEWDRSFAVNGQGAFFGTRHAIPEMRRAGGGSIINISSMAGLGHTRLQEPAYAASKAAVRILTKVTAGQYAGHAIRCNSVHPGPIDAGTADEVVTGVLYLASDQSSYTSGAELVMDGAALAD